MDRRTGRAAAEVCGAVIGAGFASGREIVSFFARFGRWSWAAVAAAGITLGGLTYGLMRFVDGHACGFAGLRGGSKPIKMVWSWAFVLLMIVTAGAMTAGAGEIAALALPIGGAYWIGMAVTLAAAMVLNRVCLTALSPISRGLILCLSLMLLMGLILPDIGTARVEMPGNSALRGVEAVLHGLCYGGFNMALAAPLLCEVASGLNQRQKCRCVVAIAGILTALLLAGNALLQKHPLLQQEAMPMIRLMQAFGKAGYALGCIAMYLAVFTTLMAALRGMTVLLPPTQRWIGLIGVIGTALLGFTGVVGMVYPVLGGICFVLLLFSLGRKGEHQRAFSPLDS